MRSAVLTTTRILRVFSSGREQLDWLLTKKPIAAYVGVDPTAPSMHVGHLLPFMALFWMYLNGYPAVSLVSATHAHPKLELTLWQLGTGTVKIGDPSGRTTERARQADDVRSMNVHNMHRQLQYLWTNVKCLGIKHNFPTEISREFKVLSNHSWLANLSAVDLMRDLGSGMRLGSMLARDS